MTFIQCDDNAVLTLPSAESAKRWFESLKKDIHLTVFPEYSQKIIRIAILDTGAQLPEMAKRIYRNRRLVSRSWLSAEFGPDGDPDRRH